MKDIRERYTVDSVVCDYGIFENGELIPQLIFNSSTNAKLVCKIMNLDANHKVAYEDEQMELLGYIQCDPQKNEECKKTNCYLNGGECRYTRKTEYGL